MKQKYELMAIISGNIIDTEIQKRLKGIRDLLGKEIVYEEFWGMRDFAYPIKKQSKGYYAIWNFIADTETIKTIEEGTRLYPDLLRKLLIKVPDDYTPITLKEIDAGLETLREEKAEKRAKKTGGGKKPERKETKVQAKDRALEEVVEEKPLKKQKNIPEPAVENSADSSKTPIISQKEEEEIKTEEVKIPEKSYEEKRSILDKKLDDILNDTDLNL